MVASPYSAIAPTSAKISPVVCGSCGAFCLDAHHTKAPSATTETRMPRMDSGERRRGRAGTSGRSEVLDSVLRALQDGTRRGGFEPESHLPRATSLCTLTVQMSRYSLRLAHDLKPAMTGWNWFVAAERIV